MELENPFTPSFSEIPAHMTGRRDIVRPLGGCSVASVGAPGSQRSLAERKAWARPRS